ncbi:hypothetical protein MYP_4458 [Sporocytophaga myxococcoides]|uniref:Uncharacterized protein n=1 Tax=Sporocytophaga myxococcoides TaxID=153721 RepID=A0A098LMJ1_9BACT|nr:hypothetical protein [Sporocytophaga myxococcoides]GAL87228.1 hypothetical protein MYP_4458 [Sporocytophaga myxococcoides]
MKLLGTIIFSLGVVFLLTGIHQTMTVGFKESYWLFMLCFMMLMVFQWAKGKSPEKQDNNVKSEPTKKVRVKK